MTTPETAVEEVADLLGELQETIDRADRVLEKRESEIESAGTEDTDEPSGWEGALSKALAGDDTGSGSERIASLTETTRGDSGGSRASESTQDAEDASGFGALVDADALRKDYRDIEGREPPAQSRNTDQTANTRGESGESADPRTPADRKADDLERHGLGPLAELIEDN